MSGRRKEQELFAESATPRTAKCFTAWHGTGFQQNQCMRVCDDWTQNQSATFSLSYSNGSSHKIQEAEVLTRTNSQWRRPEKEAAALNNSLCFTNASIYVCLLQDTATMLYQPIEWIELIGQHNSQSLINTKFMPSHQHYCCKRKPSNIRSLIGKVIEFEITLWPAIAL